MIFTLDRLNERIKCYSSYTQEEVGNYMLQVVSEEGGLRGGGGGGLGRVHEWEIKQWHSQAQTCLGTCRPSEFS